MRALKATDVALCMNHVLAKETFDSFLLAEAEVFTGLTLSVDGHLRQEFYSKEDYEERKSKGDFIPYAEVRSILFDAIKGKKTPNAFRLVLVTSRPATKAVLQRYEASPEGVGGLYLNLRYDHEGVSLVTGVSMTDFTMDKSAEAAWDRYLPEYLESLGIPFEIMG